MSNKINLDSISIGSDPEFFVFNPTSKLHEIAINMVKGTKEFPEPISNKGHFIQIDGVALEGNIPACKTSEELIYNINWLKDWIQQTLLDPKQLIISEKCNVKFQDIDLVHPQANEIGCSPDLCVYDLCFKEPKSYKDNWRAVAGHIHIGYDNPTEETSIQLAKAFDLFVTLPSVLLDSDDRRRKLYGQAGSIRFKPFGVEVRTLSNFWCFDNNLIKWVFDNTIEACKFVNINGIITNEKDIQKAINTYDRSLALDIIEDYKISLAEGYNINTLIEQLN